METWPSGRRHLTANEAGDKTPRGFESRRLRQNNEPNVKALGDFVLAETAGFEGRRRYTRRAKRVLVAEPGSRVLSILQAKRGKIFSNS